MRGILPTSECCNVKCLAFFAVLVRFFVNVDNDYDYFEGKEEAGDRDELRSKASGLPGHMQHVQQTVSDHYDNDYDDDDDNHHERNNDHNDYEGTWVRLSRR